MIDETARTELGAMTELAAELNRFGGTAQRVCEQAGRVARDVCDRINQELASRTAELASARSALNACLADPSPGRDCSGEARQVDHAQRRHDAAQRARSIADAAAGSLRPALARYSREQGTLVPAARSWILGRQGDAERYLAAGSGSLGVSSGLSSVGSSAGPSESIGGAPEGWVMVPLDSVDTSDSSVTGPGDFDGDATAENLGWWFTALHEVVLPAMRHGYGADYFRDRDRDRGLSGIRSYLACYEGFFGTTSVKLALRPDGRYEVINGYHRLWLARHLGETGIPARVR